MPGERDDPRLVDATETVAMRAALDEFAKTLIAKLSPDSAAREELLRKLQDTSHLHQSVLVLASTLPLLSRGEKPQGMLLQVLIKFGPMGDAMEVAAAVKGSGRAASA